MDLASGQSFSRQPWKETKSRNETWTENFMGALSHPKMTQETHFNGIKH